MPVTLLGLGRVSEAKRWMDDVAARWPDSPVAYFSGVYWRAWLGEWEAVDAMLTTERLARYPKGNPIVRSYLAGIRGLRLPPDERAADCERRLQVSFELYGGVPFAMLGNAVRVGDADLVWDYVDRTPFERLREPGALCQPDDTGRQQIIFSVTGVALRQDPRFVRLCTRLGLADYWVSTGHWPDCADEVAPSYDFRAACERAVRGD